MTAPTTSDVQIAARFGLASSVVVRDHVGYRGTRTLELSDGSRSIFVRRYAEYWRDREAQVRYELAWLEQLARHGLAVPTALRTLDGDQVVFDAGLPVTAFAPLGGEPRYPMTPEDAALLGRTLADVHRCPAPPAGPGVFRYDRSTLLDGPLTFGARFLSAEDAREWAALGDRWRACVSAIPLDASTFGAVHADLHQWNVLWATDVPHLLDFALCGQGYRLYDLAGFLWPRRDDTASDPAVAAMCDAFVDGYRSRCDLCREEVAALDVFVKLRDLWELRDFADWDEKFDATRDVPGYLARFRAHPI